jgi:hypothetical protein
VFALPAVPDVLTQRELVVLAVRSGSQTAIRVDAQVVWLPARPVAERVPPAARVLTVTPVFGFNPAPRAARLDRAFTVTDPATANLALLPDLVTRAPAAGWWFVQDRNPRPEQEFGVGVRRAVGLGDAVGEPQRRHTFVGPVDLAEYVAGLASEPNDPGRPLACCGSAVSVHMFSMAGRAVPRQWQ